MNAHPFVGVNPPGPTTAVAFAPDAIYELRIDTNGDAVADIAYRVRFTSSESGAQTATVRRAEGAQATGIGDDGQVILEGAPVSTGSESRVTEAGDYRFFAGWRSDPFFFDVEGALNNLQFSGSDYFADKDVCCIVLEVPNSRSQFQNNGGLWARTLDGAPAGNGVAGGSRCAVQSNSLPCRRAERRLSRCGAGGRCPFHPHVRARAGAHRWICAAGSNARIAATLLPDVLHYDPARAASYPVNGRTLTDDVVDLFLPILTNGKVTQDKVGPHKDLLTIFPYVAPPHKAYAELAAAAAKHP